MRRWIYFRFSTNHIQIQDPRCSKNFSWVQGQGWNFGSGSDPRSKIQEKIENLSAPDPREVFWKSWILDPCALGSQVWQLSRLEIPSLTAVQTPIFKSNVIYVYVYVHLCKSFPGRSQGVRNILNINIYIYTPVVPHKAVAEVSKIGNL